MNILVTGANGQLGTEMRIVSENGRDNYIFTDIAELDITNIDDIKYFVKNNNISVIINCAAYTNVEQAEDEKEFAELLNEVAVKYLAETMKDVDGWLIHVSTDYVFDGTSSIPYTEDQGVNPIGVYGLTKLGGEKAIQHIGCKHIILRTSWLYSEFGGNFVKTMMSLTATKPQLKVVFDQVGTPTYAYDLAKLIFYIIENNKYQGNEGIYHFSNEGVASWYDFTKEIVKLNENGTCEIRPCHSDQFPSKVIRPSFSVLDKTKIKLTFNIEIPYWRDSLQVCISNLNNNNQI